MNSSDRLAGGSTASDSSPDAELRHLGEELRQIGDALRGLRYGAVTVIVQDGVVIQIDRMEKRRLRRPGS
jgi:hypothetical protein